MRVRSFVIHNLRGVIQATCFITCSEPLLFQTLFYLFESPLSILNSTSSAFEFVQNKLSTLVLIAACLPLD